jgi:hypothetical protein
MKTTYLTMAAVLALSLELRAADNGVPVSEIQEWKEIYNPTTGSLWRTKFDQRTGEMVMYNPFTSEIWRNPVTGQAEAVLREDWVDPSPTSVIEKATKTLSGPGKNGNGDNEQDSSGGANSSSGGSESASTSTPSKRIGTYQDRGSITRFPGTYLEEPDSTPSGANGSKQAPPVRSTPLKPYTDSGNVTRFPGRYLPEEGKASSNPSTPSSSAKSSDPGASFSLKQTKIKPGPSLREALDDPADRYAKKNPGANATTTEAEQRARQAEEAKRAEREERARAEAAQQAAAAAEAERQQREAAQAAQQQRAAEEAQRLREAQFAQEQAREQAIQREQQLENQRNWEQQLQRQDQRNPYLHH